MRALLDRWWTLFCSGRGGRKCWGRAGAGAGGFWLVIVTMTDDDIYRPTSIDANIVDLKLSRLAFKENKGNMFHFNVQGHFDAGLQATTAPNKLLLSNYQDSI